jgi:hypothetical protein
MSYQSEHNESWRAEDAPFQQLINLYLARYFRAHPVETPGNHLVEAYQDAERGLDGLIEELDSSENNDAETHVECRSLAVLLRDSFLDRIRAIEGSEDEIEALRRGAQPQYDNFSEAIRGNRQLQDLVGVFLEESMKEEKKKKVKGKPRKPAPPPPMSRYQILKDMDNGR